MDVGAVPVVWPPTLLLSGDAGPGERVSFLVWWSLVVAVVALMVAQGRMLGTIVVAWVVAVATAFTLYFLLFVLHKRRMQYRPWPCGTTTDSVRVAQSGADGPLCDPQHEQKCPTPAGPAPRFTAIPVEEMYRRHMRPDYDALLRMELFLRQEHIAAPQADVSQTVMPFIGMERPGPLGGVW
jgi:hypothetical protein